jgi:fluoroquinolone transport system permease protein
MGIVPAFVNDVRLQVRYGLYLVSGLMVLAWGAILGAAGRAVELSMPLLLPPIVVMNLLITTFYFMAALVLFEKSEGVLTALVVTPLGSGRYLASKAVSLTLLGTAETLLIAAILFPGIAWPRLIAASLLLGFFYACAGFVAIVRYDSINSFLLPSVVMTTLLVFPLAGHFGFVGREVMAIHPVEPFLRLMAGGGAWAVAGSIAWCAVAFEIARRSFARWAVRA